MYIGSQGVYGFKEKQFGFFLRGSKDAAIVVRDASNELAEDGKVFPHTALVSNGVTLTFSSEDYEGIETRVELKAVAVDATNPTSSYNFTIDTPAQAKLAASNSTKIDLTNYQAGYLVQHIIKGKIFYRLAKSGAEWNSLFSFTRQYSLLHSGESDFSSKFTSLKFIVDSNKEASLTSKFITTAVFNDLSFIRIDILDDSKFYNGIFAVRKDGTYIALPSDNINLRDKFLSSVDMNNKNASGQRMPLEENTFYTYTLKGIKRTVMKIKFLMKGNTGNINDEEIKFSIVDLR